MTNKNKLLSLLFTFLFSFTALSGPIDLEKGWHAFNNNKRKEARTLFNNATKSKTTREEAYLSLCFLDLAEGKDDEAFTHFKKFFAISLNPYPYTLALWGSGVIPGATQGKKSENIFKFLKTISEDKNANGTVKAIANYEIGHYFRSLADYKKAQNYFDKTGLITKWSMTGPFDNTSGSGFDKAYAPITHPKDNETFHNKARAEVTWIEAKNLDNSSWTNFNYYFYTGDALLFAQTFVNSSEEQEVNINTGISGSLKLWLNDQLIYSSEKERSTTLDVFSAKVKLHKGYNRILIQVGESESDGSSFFVRLTDENYNKINGLTYSHKYQPYTKETNFKPIKNSILSEEFLKNKIKENPYSSLYPTLLTEAYLFNEKTNEAREILMAARKKAPNNSYLAYLEVKLLSIDENRTKLTKILEWLKDKDPESYVSMLLLYNEAYDREDYDEAKKINTNIENNYGVSIKTYQNTIKLLSAKEKYDDMIKIVDEGFKKYPESIYLLRMKYLIEKNANKNTVGALAILENYLAKINNTDMQKYLANEYLNNGYPEKGMKKYKSLIKNNPVMIGYVRTIANKYFKQRKYGDALEWINKALDQAPYVNNLWSTKGSILEQTKKTKVAISAYEKSIYYDPNDYDIRKKLTELKGEKNVYSYFDEIDVYDLYKKAPDASDYPDDNSIIIHKEVQRIVYPEGVSEEKVITLVKVFNNTGIDDWKEYNISQNYYYQHLIIEKAEVLKPDGSKIPAETSGGRIVFTNLQPNDGIHITYRLENTSYGRLLGQFWDQFFFNTYIPSIKSKYQILAAKNVEFKSKVNNSDMQPTKKDLGDYMLYSWETKNEEAVRYEYYMPPLVDVAKVLHITTLPDWNFISTWYSDLVTSKVKADYEVKQVLKDIFPKGTDKLSDMEKAKRIYDYVSQKIAYSSIPFRQGAYVPQKASKTINTQLGDCKDVSTLYVSMAKEVGLDANIVLIETKDNGEKDMILPSIGFNHAIVNVNINQKSYFIELTNDKNPFNVSDPYLNGAMILKIDGKEAQLEPLDGKNANPIKIIRDMKVTFDKRNINVTTSSIKTSGKAAYMRSSYKDLNRKSMRQEMTSAISSDYSNKVELKDLNFTNLDNTADSVLYNYSYRVKNEVIEINDMRLIKVPWIDGIRSLDFLGDDNRKYPFNFWRYNSTDYYKQTLTVVVPPGKKIITTPKPQEFSYKGLKYKVSYKQTGNTIKGVREMTYGTDVFTVEEYPKLKEFFEKVSDADAKYVGFE